MPSGVNAFLSDSCTPPAVEKTSFVPAVSPAACACLSRMGASPDQKDEKIRSGLACWSAATWDVKSVVPSLGHSSATGVTPRLCFFRIARNVAQQSRPYE